MKSVDPEIEKQIASPAALEDSAVVKGPSCPAAFANWWAEYRNKLASPALEGFRAVEEKMQ